MFFLMPLVLPLVAAPVFAANEALTITRVSADRAEMQAGQEPVAIHFHLNKKARTTLNVYDARGYLVREIPSAKNTLPGDHQLLWDGNDRAGRFLPPEVYYYTLSAKTPSGEQATHDLTDSTGGETVIIEDVVYDPQQETLTYVVPKTARVFLRAGLENGFVVRTLINGAIRTAGRHQLHWNGMDADNVITLKNHPKLRFYGEGYQLSQNSVAVVDSLKPRHQPQWLPIPQKAANWRQPQAKPKGLNRHAYHPADKCRDIDISLDLPANLPRDANGVPLLTSAIALKTSVAARDILMMEAERSEIVYFLDNQLLYENEASYFPYTWTWQPRNLPSGTHYLTAFIVGFNEHFGVATVKVSAPENNRGGNANRKGLTNAKN